MLNVYNSCQEQLCYTREKVRLVWLRNNKPIQIGIQITVIYNLGLLSTELLIGSSLPLSSNTANKLCVDEGGISGQGVEGNHREDMTDTVIDH